MLFFEYTDTAEEVIHVTGNVGSAVKVSCSYDEGYESYEKYLCKNDCGDSDVLVTTSESRKNKYRIHDDKTARIFTTTISDLHSADAGKYWCGVTRTGKDIYTEVELKLGEQSKLHWKLHQDSVVRYVIHFCTHYDNKINIFVGYVFV
uniref:Immunoglobulin V-set domain-containing protein n=1 Tax=Pundamilia nyererei TaxID=303518 RepID=A0A3B4FBI6_9CICH